MKSITVFCLLVAGVSCYSIGSVRMDSGYGQQRQFIEQVPQMTRIRIAESPLRLEPSYGMQHQGLEVERPINAVRVLQEDIPITRFDHVINPNAGAYSLDFSSANGIVSQESGFLKNVPVARFVSGGNGYGYGGEATRMEEVVESVQTKSGTTSWCSPEGIRFTLTYTADELGYHPEITKGLCDNYVAAPVYEQSRSVVPTQNY